VPSVLKIRESSFFFFLSFFTLSVCLTIDKNLKIEIVLRVQESQSLP